jgi:hypothetical protein
MTQGNAHPRPSADLLENTENISVSFLLKQEIRRSSLGDRTSGSAAPNAKMRTANKTTS